MLELIILESVSVSIRRRSSTTSIVIETVLVTIILLTIITLDYTLERDIARDR